MFDTVLYDQIKYDSLLESLLVIQDLLHSQSIDSLNLIQQHLLAIQYLLHSQNIDIINLIIRWKERLDELKEWNEKLFPSQCRIFTILHQQVYSNNGSLVVICYTHYTIWKEHPNINQSWIEKGG